MPVPSRSRRASHRAPRRHVPDPCPLCRSDLGGAGGTTRRHVVWTPEPGVFVWRCPDCAGAWADDVDAPATHGVDACR